MHLGNDNKPNIEVGDFINYTCCAAKGLILYTHTQTHLLASIALALCERVQTIDMHCGLNNLITIIT